MWIDLPHDADGCLRIGHGESRPHRIAFCERNRLLALCLQRFAERDKPIRRKLGDGWMLEHAQLHAGIFYQRILRIKLRQRINLIGRQQCCRLSAFTCHHNGDVFRRVHAGVCDQRASHDSAGRSHTDHTNFLALEIGDRLEWAGLRHGKAIDVALVGGVEKFDICALGADHQNRFGARQREQDFPCRDELGAVA